MKVEKSKNADNNYLAEVVLIDNIKPHPNADRLEVSEMFGGSVILGKGSYSLGQKVVFFPIETTINAEFLSHMNLFDNAALNADGRTKGFFTKSRRVKPVKLRGVASEGFVLPVEKIAEFFKARPEDFKTGQSFDTIGGVYLLSKWEPKSTQNQSSEPKRPLPKWLRLMPRPIRKVIGNRFFSKKDEGIKSMLVENQFRLHYDTDNILKAQFVITPEDEINISCKMHGCASTFSNILSHREKTFWQKLTTNPKIKGEQYYRFVAASRNVIQNRRAGGFTDNHWGDHARLLDGKIPDGFSIFGEIVGGTIQKNYDYGCLPNQTEFYAFRMSKTSPEGEVTEMSFKYLQKFCRQNGIKVVPVYYQGAAQDLFPEIPKGEGWNKAFFEKLKERYLEKDCVLCKNKVPDEGIVLRNESSTLKKGFKLKSFAFLQKESKERDEEEK